MIKYQLPRSKQKKKVSTSTRLTKTWQPANLTSSSFIILSDSYLWRSCEEHESSSKKWWKESPNKCTQSITRRPHITNLTNFGKVWKGFSSFQPQKKRVAEVSKNSEIFAFRLRSLTRHKVLLRRRLGEGPCGNMWNTSYGRLFKISANTRTYHYVPTYMNHEIVINTLSNNLWRCWNHVYSVYSIKRIKEPDSVLRCLFGDCFLPAWAAQRRWQGQ